MPLLQNPTFLIIGINLSLIIFSYLWLYPFFVGGNANKLLVFDTAFNLFALIIAAVLYWGTGTVFNLLGWETNWFWFCIVSYFLFEMPFYGWYIWRFLLPHRSDKH